MYSSAKIDLLTCRALSDRIILRFNFHIHVLGGLFISYNLLDLHAVLGFFVKEISKEIKHKCRETL